MLASVTMCNDDIRNNSKISDLGYLTLVTLSNSNVGCYCRLKVLY